MDKGQTTTRKGFLKKAGITAGLTFSCVAGGLTTRKTNRRSERVKSSAVDTAGEIASRRLKPAQGTVRYRA